MVLAGCVQFNVSREIGFNIFKSVKVYLSEILVFWPHLSLSTVSSSLWIGPLLEEMESYLTRHCGSYTKVSVRYASLRRPIRVVNRLPQSSGSPDVAAGETKSGPDVSFK